MALQSLELRVPSADFQAQFGNTAHLACGLLLVVREANTPELTPCNAIHGVCHSAAARLQPPDGFRPWLEKVSHCLRFISTQHACTYPHHVYLIIVQCRLMAVCQILETRNV